MKTPQSAARTLLVAWLAFFAGAAGPIGASGASNHGAIETVKEFVAANELADLARILDTFDDEATVFFPGGQPQRASGKAEIRAAFAQIFKRRTGPISITVRDIEVQSFDDVVVVTAHLAALPSAPALEPTVFPRRTFVLRRAGERWLIVHHHASNFTVEPSRS